MRRTSGFSLRSAQSASRVRRARLKVRLPLPNAWATARLRRQAVAVGEQGFEPGHQLARPVRVGVVAPELGQCAVQQLVADEGGAVGGDPGDRARAGRAARGIGEVVRHAGLDVGQLAAEVGLELDDGGAPHGVDAAAVVEQVDLVGDLVVGRAEAFAQEFGDVAAQGLVPGRPAMARTSSGSLSRRQVIIASKRRAHDACSGGSRKAVPTLRVGLCRLITHGCADSGRAAMGTG